MAKGREIGKVTERARRRRLRCVVVDGFACPLCGGGKLRVVKSIQRKGEPRIRHVLCRACGGKFAVVVRGASDTLWT